MGVTIKKQGQEQYLIDDRSSEDAGQAIRLTGISTYWVVRLTDGNVTVSWDEGQEGGTFSGGDIWQIQSLSKMTPQRILSEESLTERNLIDNCQVTGLSPSVARRIRTIRDAMPVERDTRTGEPDGVGIMATSDADFLADSPDSGQDERLITHHLDVTIRKLGLSHQEIEGMWLSNNILLKKHRTRTRLIIAGVMLALSIVIPAIGGLFLLVAICAGPLLLLVSAVSPPKPPSYTERLFLMQNSTIMTDGTAYIVSEGDESWFVTVMPRDMKENRVHVVHLTDGRLAILYDPSQRLVSFVGTDIQEIGTDEWKTICPNGIDGLVPSRDLQGAGKALGRYEISDYFSPSLVESLRGMGMRI